MKDKLKAMRSKWHNDLLIAHLNELQENTSNGVYLKDMLSYFSNQMLISQGVADKTVQYKYYYQLHKLLNIERLDSSDYTYTRIGKAHDGGYILAVKKDGTPTDTKTAYSLGICHDVSFDLAIAKKGYEVYQYDHTIDALPKNCRRFHWRKLGLTGKNETEQLKSLETVIRQDKNDNKSGMLLKCDIEGWEWDMLADCSDDILCRFDQIVIELHDLLDLTKSERILSVLGKLAVTHQAIHIHSNNNRVVNYSSDLITPDVLEVTYVLKSKYKTRPCDILLPTELDQVNNVNLIDVPLGRWNVK